MEDLSLNEEFQLVVFHPNFLFADGSKDDPANFTNRSPYPMIHILRSDSVSKAIDHHPNVENIPLENMEKLRTKSFEYWEKFRMGIK